MLRAIIPFKSPKTSAALISTGSSLNKPAVMLFDQDADVIRARQLVQERLATESRQLPAAAKPPVILQPLSSTSRVMKIGVWSDTLSQRDLTDPGPVDDPAEADVGPRRRQRGDLGPAEPRVPGARRSRPAAGRGRPARRGDEGRGRRHRCSSPAGSSTRRTSGWRSGTCRPSPSRDDLADTVVAFRDGAPVRLGEVAQIVEGSPPPIGDAVINDGPGLLLIVEKHPWGNTLDVTRKVEEALEPLKPGLKDVDVDHTIFRPATFIETVDLAT